MDFRIEVGAFCWTASASEIIALQERDRVRTQYRPYVEHCVLMGLAFPVLLPPLEMGWMISVFQGEVFIGQS